MLRPQSKAICSLTDSKFSFWQAPFPLSPPHLPLLFHCPPAPLLSPSTVQLCGPLSTEPCVPPHPRPSRRVGGVWVMLRHPFMCNCTVLSTDTSCAVGPGNWFLMFASQVDKEKECIQTQSVFLFWTKATGACWIILSSSFMWAWKIPSNPQMMCAWVMPSVTCTGGFFVDPVNTSSVLQFT